MSLETHRQYAANATLLFMNTNFPGVPVKFQNVSFNQPQTTWTAFYILDGKSFICSLGTKKVDRHVGLLQLDVMVPAQAGIAQAFAIGEAWGKAMRDQDVGLTDGATAKTKTYDVTDMGSHNGFYRVVFRVSYWRDEAPQ